MHDWWLPGLQILNALIIGRSFSFSLFARDISVLSLLVRSLADRWGAGAMVGELGMHKSQTWGTNECDFILLFEMKLQWDGMMLLARSQLQ